MRKGIQLKYLYEPIKGSSAGISDLHKSLPAGGKLLLADLGGPGVIGHIALTHMNWMADHRLESMRGVIIRCFWDGEAKPSVEVPIGDFFGIGFGEDRQLDCAIWERDGHCSLHSCFPMPFRKRALIELENLNAFDLYGFYWNIEYDKGIVLPDDLEYFHAHYHQSHPVPKIGWHTVLDAKGHGKYVGTIWSVNWMDNRKTPENAVSYFVDGQPVQCVNSEDYFCQSWGFREEPFKTTYAGQGLGFQKTDCGTTQMSSYRIHLPNPILFQESFKFVMDCQGYQQGYRCDTYDTVAFWYQNHPSLSFPTLPPVEELLPIQCEKSWWHKLWKIHQAEKDCRFGEAVSIAEELVKLCPHNPKVPDILFKKAAMKSRLGDTVAAMADYRHIIEKYPQSDAAQDAHDKLWCLEKTGRLLLTLVTPSGWTAYLDGKEIKLPDSLFREIPDWGHPVQYRYGRKQALQLGRKEDKNTVGLKPGDPIPVVSDPYSSTVYTKEENHIRWDDSSSSVMRLFSLRLEPGPGKHVIAVEARLSNKIPLILESQMPGGLIAVLDDGGCETIMADGTWLVTWQKYAGWQEPVTTDAGWKTATVYANESYGDSAWFWMSSSGFRRFPGDLVRIWGENRNDLECTLYFRKTFSLNRKVKRNE